MKEQSRWIILALLISAAIGCYLIGFKPGFGFFLVLGVGFELAFWLKLFKRKKIEK
jgi:hypothetical protein